MTQEELNSIILSYNNYLQRLTDATAHFCEDLVASNYREISGVLPAVVEGLGWVSVALENFVKMGCQTEESLATFRGLVVNLYEALENKDYVLLHDLCEFELLPLLNNIKITEKK